MTTLMKRKPVVTIYPHKIIYSKHPIDFDKVRDKLNGNEFSDKEKALLLYRNFKRIIRIYNKDRKGSADEYANVKETGFRGKLGFFYDYYIKTKFYQDYNLKRQSVLGDSKMIPLTTDQLLQRGFNTLCFFRNSITVRDSNDVTTADIPVKYSINTKSDQSNLGSIKYLDTSIEYKILNNIKEFEISKFGNKEYKNAFNPGEKDMSRSDFLSLMHFVKYAKQQSQFQNQESTHNEMIAEEVKGMTKYLENMRLFVSDDAEVITEPTSNAGYAGNRDDENNSTTVTQVAKGGKRKRKGKASRGLEIKNADSMVCLKFERDLILFNESHGLLL